MLTAKRQPPSSGPAISVESLALFFLWSTIMKPVPIGARGEAEETVEFKHTLTSHHPELPPVYSTPDMIRLMELHFMRCTSIVRVTRSRWGLRFILSIVRQAWWERESEQRRWLSGSMAGSIPSE